MQPRNCELLWHLNSLPYKTYAHSQPTLVKGGQILSHGEDYTINGPLVSAIAYLQIGTYLDIPMYNPSPAFIMRPVITRKLPSQWGTSYCHRGQVGQPRSKPPRNWFQQRHFTHTSMRVVLLFAHTVQIMQIHLRLILVMRSPSFLGSSTFSQKVWARV